MSCLGLKHVIIEFEGIDIEEGIDCVMDCLWCVVLCCAMQVSSFCLSGQLNNDGNDGFVVEIYAKIGLFDWDQ